MCLEDLQNLSSKNQNSQKGNKEHKITLNMRSIFFLFCASVYRGVLITYCSLLYSNNKFKKATIFRKREKKFSLVHSSAHRLTDEQVKKQLCCTEYQDNKAL